MDPAKQKTYIKKVQDLQDYYIGNGVAHNEASLESRQKARDEKIKKLFVDLEEDLKTFYYSFSCRKEVEKTLTINDGRGKRRYSIGELNPPPGFEIMTHTAGVTGDIHGEPSISKTRVSFTVSRSTDGRSKGHAVAYVRYAEETVNSMIKSDLTQLRQALSAINLPTDID